MNPWDNLHLVSNEELDQLTNILIGRLMNRLDSIETIREGLDRSKFDEDKAALKAVKEEKVRRNL